MAHKNNPETTMSFSFALRRACAGAFLLASAAHAQMGPDLADKLRSMGRVIDPPATGALYAPRVLDKEPYAGVTVQRDIAYGSDPRHLLDVFVLEGAASAPRPVLIFVHGGAFTRGDRRAPGSPFYDNLMLWAVRNGMVGVNMTYRLAPKNLWPAGAQDIGLAVRWVRDNIAARGGNPGKVFLMGHSAGAAHVASYVADPRFQQVPGSGLAGALMLSGIFSLSSDLSNAESAVKMYYGDDPATFAERSAQNGLVKTQVPLWVGYAELDPPAFEPQSVGLRDALCKAGRCPGFIKFPSHSHMSEIYSVNTDDKQVSDAMLAFVRAH
jgi:triacylglycerol lipase